MNPAAGECSLLLSDATWSRKTAKTVASRGDTQGQLQKQVQVMIIPLKGGHSFDSAAMGQCSSYSSRWRGDVHGRVHLPQICLWGQVRRVVVTGSQTSGQRRLDVNVRVVTVSHGRSLSSKGIFQKKTFNYFSLDYLQPIKPILKCRAFHFKS